MCNDCKIAILNHTLKKMNSLKDYCLYDKRNKISSARSHIRIHVTLQQAIKYNIRVVRSADNSA